MDLRSSYSIFYEYDEEKKNIGISTELTRSKKSTKKLFDKNRSVIVEDDLTPSFYKTKKLYLNPECRRGQVNIQKNIFKEHLTNDSGGVFPTKKHFSINNLRPSFNTTKMNDKKRLMPSEYIDKYNKPEHTFAGDNEIMHTSTYCTRQSSVYSGNTRNKNLNCKGKSYNTISTSYTNKVEEINKKKNYPYAKDSIKEILLAEKNLKINYHNINNNPFDILHRVQKYDWEI